MNYLIFNLFFFKFKIHIIPKMKKELKNEKVKCCKSWINYDPY